VRQSDKAALRLRQLILDGDLPVGEHLSEPSLADRLRVSRTPVRAALVRLEHEGLVEPLPSGGYQIRVFHEKEIADAVEVRGAVEGIAARFAAELRPNRSEIATLHECLSRIDGVVRRNELTEEDFYQYVDANRDFHEIIISLARSDVLRHSLERSASFPFASASAFVMAEAELPESKEILFVAQDQHHCLVDAIASGDGARAESLAREHARVTIRHLRLVLNNQDARKRIPGLQLVRRASATS